VIFSLHNVSLNIKKYLPLLLSLLIGGQLFSLNYVSHSVSLGAFAYNALLSSVASYLSYQLISYARNFSNELFNTVKSANIAFQATSAQLNNVENTLEILNARLNQSQVLLRDSNEVAHEIQQSVPLLYEQVKKVLGSIDATANESQNTVQQVTLQAQRVSDNIVQLTHEIGQLTQTTRNQHMPALRHSIENTFNTSTQSLATLLPEVQALIAKLQSTSENVAEFTQTTGTLATPITYTANAFRKAGNLFNGNRNNNSMMQEEVFYDCASTTEPQLK
jgi:chromosome segregation ATPase